MAREKYNTGCRMFAHSYATNITRERDSSNIVPIIIRTLALRLFRDDVRDKRAGTYIYIQGIYACARTFKTLCVF